MASEERTKLMFQMLIASIQDLNKKVDKINDRQENMLSTLGNINGRLDNIRERSFVGAYYPSSYANMSPPSPMMPFSRSQETESKFETPVSGALVEEINFSPSLKKMRSEAVPPQNDEQEGRSPMVHYQQPKGFHGGEIRGNPTKDPTTGDPNECNELQGEIYPNCSLTFMTLDETEESVLTDLDFEELTHPPDENPVVLAIRSSTVVKSNCRRVASTMFLLICLSSCSSGWFVTVGRQIVLWYMCVLSSAVQLVGSSQLKIDSLSSVISIFACSYSSAIQPVGSS